MNKTIMTHYDLIEYPFSKEIPTDKLLSLPSIEKTVETECLFIETKEIGVLIGKSGTGKSCLLGLLMERPDPGLYKKGICDILKRHGRITKLYVDNGSTFISGQTERIMKYPEHPPGSFPPRQTEGEALVVDSYTNTRVKRNWDNEKNRNEKKNKNKRESSLLPDAIKPRSPLTASLSASKLTVE